MLSSFFVVVTVIDILTNITVVVFAVLITNSRSYLFTCHCCYCYLSCLFVVLVIIVFLYFNIFNHLLSSKILFHCVLLICQDLQFQDHAEITKNRQMLAKKKRVRFRKFRNLILKNPLVVFHCCSPMLLLL